MYLAYVCSKPYVLSKPYVPSILIPHETLKENRYSHQAVTDKPDKIDCAMRISERQISPVFSVFYL